MIINSLNDYYGDDDGDDSKGKSDMQMRNEKHLKIIKKNISY